MPSKRHPSLALQVVLKRFRQKAKQLCGPMPAFPAGARHLFQEAQLLNPPTEIAPVQRSAQNHFAHGLQLAQRELGGQQLKAQRRFPELSA